MLLPGLSEFRKLLTCLLLMLTIALQASAQNGAVNLPVVTKAPATTTTAPLILYITGDGGMKKFSANVIESFHQQNYPVVALNALKYFWNKKTPQQAARDVANLISYYQSQWGHQQGVVLIGYSLGADVLPFIYNSLPANVAAEVKHVVLLSPSLYTDLEVHVSDMLGKSSTRGMSVPAEINKMTGKPLLLVFGAEEKDFNFSALNIQYQKLILPGGHAYDEDANGVAGKILTSLHP
ncbi:AcvB/VirJ family lysyl-phosphatidylglycerol hydrolase [Chitinophaga sp. Ak27]|uniref:AcvB/VirJ family lysyl-phosphatidylglycerol hydrolase n=1 Tax=Chitinophaga sp. Ak27 TaxID=2726116 RepID=UPI00145E8851|nr:AcvB/VirJ family lysyl-phosphatidylglycerol hydrolase [Chitinophaga sp. Ak27]NLU96228.1 virulence factor family protein [Chitinophaga sp. Ak27]